MSRSVKEVERGTDMGQTPASSSTQSSQKAVSRIMQIDNSFENESEKVAKSERN